LSAWVQAALAGPATTKAKATLKSATIVFFLEKFIFALFMIDDRSAIYPFGNSADRIVLINC